MRIWDRVSMDVFSMPGVQYRGVVYDSILLCVDRHTGWIIAIPTQKCGLTAERSVELMLQKWTDLGGGIPSVITSDKGAQFVGGWFKTMCKRLGVRQAYSQAYRPQANGRAERAGRQLIEWLEKINTDMEINWVEALPMVLRQYHDAVGESGFSPYEVVFGRYRNLPGIPCKPPEVAEDAWYFLERQERVDRRVAEVLNKRHEAAVDRVNRSRAPRAIIAIGTKVWVYKQKKVGGYKLEPRWWGPATVSKRIGESSYEISWEEGTFEVHIDDLKEYMVEEFQDEGEELWYINEEGEGEAVEEGSAAVEGIITHRVQEKGTMEFLVKWLGWGEDYNPWEPASSFTKCCQPWAEYCDRHEIQLKVHDLIWKEKNGLDQPE